VLPAGWGHRDALAEGDGALFSLETFWRNNRWPLLSPQTLFDPARN
jgi:hypothetical protein